MSEKSDMSFLDHLEELRWRLVKSIGAIVLGGILAYLFIDDIIAILIAPTEHISSPMILQVLTVQGMFMIKWGMSIVGGFILALPVITYQMAKFITPGLYKNEKKFMIPLVFFSYISFIIGVVFAYMIIIPFSLQFFSSLGMSDIQNNYSINYYFSFIIWLMLGSGIIFELPVMVFILSVIGILTPPFMRHYRKHALIVILLLSAFITPPDPVSLLFMSLPLVLLYELSIGVSWIVNKRNKEA
ncbi:MAG: twin-arginine translocase subunit TatC [Candidatus Marinimicrobia bacterium]|nr:twin-arginine translocase subunit TatC [Candidatus Neomarinimicrobiota bacterium]MCH7762598.1 twin-arginine translocase subunit TatC [Candidatus Neomarinimicrobiota bacterium]